MRFGMVGGGEGAFIGAVHRSAAWLDGELELVCGAFSGDADTCRSTGEALGLDTNRCYADFATMMQVESSLPEGERMQFVSIVTPNDLHYPVAARALERGFHVLSDKPATMNLDQCRSLRDLIDETGLLYGLTHTYTAYPMIAEARQRVADGQLGAIRKVLVEYTQGWLAEPLERTGHRQAGWRLDPERAGPSCCMGDIGVHAFNLVEHVGGVEVTELDATLHRTVRGRRLDDDGTVLLRFANGAHGTLVASQVCIGDENNLRLRIYGDEASLDWQQQEPNSLWIRYPGRPTELLRTAGPYLGPAAADRTRIPAGHPEGYLEAFANIYRDFAAQVGAHERGEPFRGEPVPGIREALRGMAFIETAVSSSESPQKWHLLPMT